MKTIDDLIQFAQRLDKTPKIIAEFITAINKCLVPVLKDVEMLDVTVLSINEVTRRGVADIKADRTLETYRDRVRRLLRLFKQHIEVGGVALVDRPLKYRESVMERMIKPDLYGNIQVTLSAADIKVWRGVLLEMLRRLPEPGEPMGNPWS